MILWKQAFLLDIDSCTLYFVIIANADQCTLRNNWITSLFTIQECEEPDMVDSDYEWDTILEFTGYETESEDECRDSID